MVTTTSWPNQSTSAPSASAPPAAPPALAVVAVVALVFAGDIFFLGLDEVTTAPTSWATVGLGVGLLSVTSRPRWPALLGALFLAVALARVVYGDPWSSTVPDAVVILVEILLGALVVTRGTSRRGKLEDLPDLLGLVGAAAVASAAAVLADLCTVIDAADDRAPLVATLVAAHLGPTLVLAAAVILLVDLAHDTSSRGAHPAGPDLLLEMAAQAVVLAGVTALVFLPHTSSPVTFLPIPVLVWAALRLPPALVAAELTVLSVVSTVTTSLGLGPFGSGVDRSVVDLGLAVYAQGYVFCVGLTVLPLALVVAQRRLLTARVVDDQELFRLNFSDSPLGMLFVRQEGLDLVVDSHNEAARRMLAPHAELTDLPGHCGVEGRRLDELVRTDEPMSMVVDSLLRGRLRSWSGRAHVVGVPEGRVDMAVAALGAATTASTFSVQLLDTSQEHQTMQRLEAAQQLTDATLDTASCVILLVDPSGRVVRVNAATAHLTGYVESDFVGRRVWETPLAPLARSEVEAMFLWPNRSGDPTLDEHSHMSAGGERLTLAWSNGVVRDEVGRASYAVLTGVDVTAQREAQRTLSVALGKERTALERLRELDRAKDEFVSTVSHELRTPITSILGYTEMLRDGSIVDPIDDQLPVLATIERSAERLVAICNDLLLLAGFDSTITEPPEPVDLGASLRQTEEAVTSLHRHRRLDVRFECRESAPGRPLVVCGVRAQLDRIALNLVSNAIKFTEDGGSITVTLQRDGDSALLSVRDTGIGIPIDDHEAVFQRFFRTEEARVRAVQGTGLGLPIVASIVHAHQGTIELDSTPGEGAEFRVRLPLHV